MSTLHPGFVLIVIGLPTLSVVLTELSCRTRRMSQQAVDRYRRSDLILAAVWLVQAALEWSTFGPTAVFWCWVYGAAAYAWSWWRAGGGDSTRRALEKGAGRVTAFGSRLIVVPAPQTAS